MSTIDNIFILRALIRHYLNKNEYLYCAFVDFTKAFDYVVRDVIWYKLLKIGVRGKMLDIIKSIYNNVKSQVKHNNTLSSSFTCNIGVRQGDNKLTKLAYKTMLNDIIIYHNKDNWASSVKLFLSRLGFFEVWLGQGVGNITNFLAVFKIRVKDIFIQDWHSRLENSLKARFYSTFDNFKYQHYLDCITLDKFRLILSRYRVSSHRLEIEAGRWTKPNKTPLENRKCKQCNTLEDEYHFVLECVLYKELRKLYIKKYYWQRPSMQKLTELVTSENINTIKRFSVYLQKAFKLRQDCLYS